ncbi:MAG: DUF6527 family protein [Sulfuriferula sp.]|nr:DUF6527 family protein [Sulfuriferula sp.]
MRTEELQPLFVETVPEHLEQGVLYVSEKYGTAIHLCACGTCGWKTVTPFHIGDRGWVYTRDAEDRITLSPSIGNQQFPCKSHYYVKANKIDWLPMGPV